MLHSRQWGRLNWNAKQRDLLTLLGEDASLFRARIEELLASQDHEREAAEIEDIALMMQRTATKLLILASDIGRVQSS